jgi:hypothetical protein
MRRLLTVVPLLTLALTACGGGDSPDAGNGPEPSPSKSIRTLTPIPLPSPSPPTGKLIADIEQSSRDAAANRFEVWINNDTDHQISPSRVTYDDDRFQTPLPGTRLRDIPSQSRRGFPIYQPDQPACDRTATSGTVTVEFVTDGESKTVTVPVEDEADVIARITSARCLELAIDKIAHLSWADEVTASGDGGEGSIGTLTLVVDTTGRPGSTLVIDSIVGNPVLSPGERGVYNPDLTITGDQPPQRVEVPIKPTRCDAHAFAESGSATAFAINVHVDGKPGQFVLRMSTAGAAQAIAYARASCGMLTSITGGEG